MSARDDEEARAAAWLQAQGYTTSRPIWLPTGQNPDFWAESATFARSQLWVEVKSIDPDDSTATMERFSRLIRDAEIPPGPPGLRGHARLELDSDAIEQSVRWVLKSFATRSAAYAGKKVSLMFLRQTRRGGREYRVEIDAETPMVVWAQADELPLNPATAIRGDMLYAPARLRTPDGSEVTGRAYQFLEPRHRMECALVLRLDPQDRVLEGISYQCGGQGQTFDRTGKALDKANKQIKTACATHDAPGLVILTPRDPFGDNDQMMQAAIYGQYTVPVHQAGDGMEHGELYHGLNGVFRHDKNTHISAAVHVRREAPATFFPNPYARHPIPDDAPVFAGAVRASVRFVQRHEKDS